MAERALLTQHLESAGTQRASDRIPDQIIESGSRFDRDQAYSAAGLTSFSFGSVPIRDPIHSQPLASSASAAPPQRTRTVQAKLTIGGVNDPLEHGADMVAERVLSAGASAPTAISANPTALQRKCQSCSEQDGKKDEEAHGHLSRKVTSGSTDNAPSAPQGVQQVLGTPGSPLEASTRALFEPRFAHDFSSVRVHNDAQAAQSAGEISARAYTVGSHVVFGSGQYEPTNIEGQRLIAHELTHVIQQGASSASPVVRRVPLGGSNDADVRAIHDSSGTGAPKAKKCGSPSQCPPGFCDPYSSAKLANYYRAKDSWWIMAGISHAVDSRVVPLWQEYLDGGSDPKNLTADFGKDFTNSPTTAKTTRWLLSQLQSSLASSPPSVAVGAKVNIDIPTRIPGSVNELDDPASKNQMNFNIPKDIPGNLAGGIGKDQLTCQSGAKPSPFNDERHALGSATVERTSATTLLVTPTINYQVKDTIDLCPGDCGTTLEQLATVPLSQFEATGISGDVPFTVDFPSPATPPFTVTTAPAAAPAAAPVAPAAPVPVPAAAPGAKAPAPAKAP